MLNPLSLPSQVVEDLHTLATALRRLAEDDGDLARLREAASKLPQVENELTAGVQSLQVDVRKVHEGVVPLNTNVVGLDHTAEALETSIAGLRDQITVLTTEIEGCRGDIAELRDKIPGL